MESLRSRSVGVTLERLRANGALVLIPGAALTLLGVIAVMSPLLTGVGTTGLLGVLLLAAGAFRAVFALRPRRLASNILGLVIAGVNLLGGLLLLSVPSIGNGHFALTLAFLLVADGLLGLVLAVLMRNEDGWGWLLASALAALVVSTMILYKWPALLGGSTAVALGLFLVLTGASVANLGAREE